MTHDPAPTFGTVLARLRHARVVTIERAYGRRGGGISRRVLETRQLSQNELSRRAGIDVAAVHRHEHDRLHPTRRTVELLADALEVTEYDRALLLVAAGYWPWPELGPEDTAIAIGVLLAVAEGDWRRLDGAAALDALRVVP